MVSFDNSRLNWSKQDDPPKSECPPKKDSTSECPPPVRNVLAPHLVYLELTPACNNRCPGCLNESFISDFNRRVLKPHFHSPSLNLSSWQTLLSRLPATITSFVLSGGEPTLYPDFDRLVRELNARDLRFVLFTNGRWQRTDHLIDLLSILDGFRGMLVSLHGSQAVSHNSFTGVEGSFEETIRNVRAAVQMKLPVNLSTVITSENWNEMDRIVELAFEVGAEGISFNRYLHSPERSMTTNAKIHPPSPSQLRMAVRQVEQLRLEYADQIHVGYGPCIPQCFVESSSAGCAAGDTSLVIDPWGNLKPCLHTDLLCGNLLIEDFKTIWAGDLLREWRGLYDSSCSGCSAFDQCGGGCRAMTRAWGLGRDPLMRQPILSFASEERFASEMLLKVIQ